MYLFPHEMAMDCLQHRLFDVADLKDLRLIISNEEDEVQIGCRRASMPFVLIEFVSLCENGEAAEYRSGYVYAEGRDEPVLISMPYILTCTDYEHLAGSQKDLNDHPDFWLLDQGFAERLAQAPKWLDASRFGLLYTCLHATYVSLTAPWHFDFSAERNVVRLNRKSALALFLAGLHFYESQSPSFVIEAANGDRRGNVVSASRVRLLATDG
ncbi:MAG: hypothetical protein RLY93_08755 [Sumerlaeia bacterium]